MNEHALILVKVLKELSKTEKDIDIFEKLGLCALDIICGINFI
jgi:hypothetical protein